MVTIGTQLETCLIPEKFCWTTWTLRNVSSLRNNIILSPKVSLFPDFECYCDVNISSASEFRSTVTSSVRFTCHLLLLNTSFDILLHRAMVARNSSVKSKSRSQLYDTVFVFTHQDKVDDELRNLPDDTLILVYFLGIPQNPVTRPLCAQNPANYLKTLATRMKRLPAGFLDQKIILCVGMETTSVLKSVLCASSPVFAKMFENGMLENIQNTVTVQDIEMPVLNNLIQFLYTGIVPDESVEHLCALYYAADKYDITELLVGCRDLLQHKITVDNAAELFKLSSVHSDEILKSYVVGFFREHLNSVLLTKGWLEMMNNDTMIALEAIATFNVDSGI